MKVLHISSFDIVGGAARAAYRIHQGLQKTGVDSQMLVQYKKSSDRYIIPLEGKVPSRLRSYLNSVPLKLYPDRQELFSPQWFPNPLEKKIRQINPDIINLNWVCNGYLRLETLAKLKQPLVWTLQDMWAFTGGCHYSAGCDRYQQTCGKCPQLKSDQDGDLSRWIWQRKATAWQNLNLTLVAPSAWMAKCAASSSLFKGLRIETIPFGLDTNIFQPIEKQQAREQLELNLSPNLSLNLPPDKHIVLFGAIAALGDFRKGFHLLQTALKKLSQTEWQNRIELVIFGSEQPENPIDLGFPAHYLGSIKDNSLLRLVYSLADVMIAPSLEEAFGQTASESLACGTPVVVFAQTGLADIVEHQQNGYVANYGDTDDLAKGIAWVLEDKKRHQQLSIQACEKAQQKFSLQSQADSYLSLFREILKHQ
jgi:glycosyltransferase involved in cell wall biosynthesis